MSDSITFNWQIENFLMCLNKVGSFFDSPTFVIDKINETKGFLRLYPTGKFNYLKITSYLHIVNASESTYGNNVKLLFITNNDMLCNWSTRRIEKNNIAKLYHSEIRAEILKPENGYLIDETFTIECKIEKPNYCSSFYIRHYAKTIVSVKSHIFKYPINLNVNKNEESTAGENSKIILYNKQTEEISEEFKFYFHSILNVNSTRSNWIEVKNLPTNETHLFTTLKLSLFCDTKETCVDVLGAISYQFDSQHFSFVLPFVLSDDQLRCLQNETSSILCEFRISDGSAISFTEHPTSINITDKTTPAQILEKIYNEKKFSDIFLQVGSDQYPANKCVLAAASPYFAAMFESGMIETKSNVINVTDFDSSTIDQMLKFLYTEQIENFKFDTARKLYSASDKYQIIHLKEKCVAYFIANLEIATVCEIFELADLHNDHELEAIARNFMYANYKVLFRTSKWKKFMEEQTKVAVDIMFNTCIKI